MISDLVREFLEDYLKRTPNLPDVNPDPKNQPYITTKQDLINMLASVELMYRWNKGKSIEDTIELVIRDSVDRFETTRKKYGTPGYTAIVKVGNFNVRLYGGNINYLGEPMQEKALFDIASMSKLYTQIIIHNLISEGIINRNDKIKNLDDRFVNIGDVTIDDIITFGVDLKTDGRIDSKSTIEECLDILYHSHPDMETYGKYRYSDIGMMVLKEVMERVTGESYEELLDKYIVKPLGLEDTHVIVPNCKLHLVTGTPNAKTGNVNDMKANAVGGFSGHAGVISSVEDAVKVIGEVAKTEGNRILPDNSDFITQNPHLNVKGNPVARAAAGDAHFGTKDGIYDGYIDNVEPVGTLGTAGSTKTNAFASSDSASAIMYNPASMTQEEIDKINEDRARQGLDPISPIRQFAFDRNGQLIKRELFDIPKVFPAEGRSGQSLSYMTVKLRFLDFLMKKQEQNIEEINFNKSVR